MAMVSFPRNITTMRLPARFFCPPSTHLAQAQTMAGFRTLSKP